MQADVGVQPWPDAFSETFLAGAQRIFDQSQHVMVVGPLGGHRGLLVAALARTSAATSWGRDVQTFGSDGLPYAAVNHLLPSLRAHPDQSVEDVVDAAGRVLGRSFGLQTVCLLEADLCDGPSTEVLARLVESGRIALISTMGPAAAATHRFARSAERIDIPPLDDQQISQLLEARFGAVPHPTTVAMLSARSQGAYAVLKELADAAYETGQITSLAGSLVTDEAVSVDLVDDAAQSATTAWPPRFAPDHPGRDLIDVAALNLQIDAGEAGELFGAEALGSALSSGAVQVADDRIVFASRVEAMQIRRSLTDARREELYERYADRLPRTVALPGVASRTAAWFRSVDRPLTADLAVRAAGQSNRECRYVEALQFVGSVPAGERPSRLLVEQGHALNETGDCDGLLALVRSVDLSSLHEDDLLAFVRWASQVVPADELARQMDDLAAQVRGDDDPRAAVLELASLYSEAFQDCTEALERRLMALTLSDRLSPVNRAMAQMVLASFLRHASRVDQAVTVAGQSVQALVDLGDDVSACHLEVARETQIMCHFSAADYEGSREALTAYSSPGVAYGNLGRLGTALWGMHAFLSGDVGSAMAHAQLALARTPDSDPHQLRGWMEAMSAQILTQVGDIDRVYELLESSSGRPSSTRRQHALECRLTQACVHDAVGDPEEALTLLQEVLDEAGEHDLLLAKIDAAVLMVQIGGPVHLRPLLDAVDGVDDSSGTSWIWRRFAEAIRDNKMRDLVALAEELDETGRAFFAAEVAQFTLDVARRAADMSPDQRRRLVAIADPMQHRHVTR